MNIFDKRPLSLILCITLGAFVFFTFYDNIVPRAILLSLLTLFFAFTFFRPARRLINVVFWRVLSLICVASIVFSFLYFDLWFKAYERYDGESTITATVTDFREYEYSTALYVETDNVDQTRFSSYDLIVYVDNDVKENVTVGSVIRFVGEINGFPSDSGFDAEGYYKSMGISGVVNEVSDFLVIGYDGYPLSKRLSNYREGLCELISSNSNSETGGLLSALLLGEKEMLPIGTKLDFMRIGISHVLALSGMHLAILAIGFSKLLSFLKVKRKPATLLTALFTVLYMALTGFSVSVTRAGIMLLISSLLYLLSVTKDSMTSLFVAVAFICVFEPCSVFDTALWLSAFATLGIVVMSEYQSKKHKDPSFLRWLFTSIASSFFAIGATFAITVLNFSATSLLAVFSTLVFSVLIEVFIYVGLLVLAFGAFIPLRYIFIPLGNLILFLAERLADIEFIYVSTDFLLVEILAVIFSVFFFGVFIIKIKRQTQAFAVLAVLLVMILGTSSVLSYNAENQDDIVFASTDGDRIIIKSDGEICAVDVSSYKNDTAYALYADFLKSNITHVDKYVITHYSYNLPEAVLTLYNTILIDEIYLPTPTDDTERGLYYGVLDALEERRVDIRLYEPEHIIKCGEADLIPIYRYTLGSEKQTLLTVLYKDEFYTYTNLEMLDGETKNMALEVISRSHTVILGRHESKSSEFLFNYELEGVSRIIVATDRMTMHADTFNYYEERNAIEFSKNGSLIR